MNNFSVSKISPTVIVILSLRIITAVLLARGLVVKHSPVSKRIRLATNRRHDNAHVLHRNTNNDASLRAKQTLITDDTIPKSRTKQHGRQQKHAGNYSDKVANGDDDCDVEEDDQFLSFEVNSFQELQRSTGFEILDDELQKQIDQATANDFLDTHVTDASYLEKVAMSSVPEQLPQPAVNAFRQRQQQQQQRQTRRKKSDDVGTTRQRRAIERPANVQRVSRDEIGRAHV